MGYARPLGQTVPVRHRNLANLHGVCGCIALIQIGILGAPPFPAVERPTIAMATKRSSLVAAPEAFAQSNLHGIRSSVEQLLTPPLSWRYSCLALRGVIHDDR
jgi:hypothetical protein